MFSKNLFILFALILSLSLISCNKNDSPTETNSNGKITGTILDNNGNPIPSANVSSQPSTSSVLTNSSGSYEISDVAPGSYTVTASKIGYTSNSVSVNVTAGGIGTADIVLSSSSNELIAHLDLESLSINGESISTSNPTVNVTAGENISGSYTVKFTHNSSESSVFPLAATPNWGNKQDVYWQDANDMMNNNTYDGNISLTAPSSSGTYYIIIASSGEFTAGQIVSATNWNVGSLIWDNGDDFYDWSTSVIETAMSNGMVNVPYTFTSGQRNANVAARTIKVVVN